MCLGRVLLVLGLRWVALGIPPRVGQSLFRLLCLPPTWRPRLALPLPPGGRAGPRPSALSPFQLMKRPPITALASDSQEPPKSPLMTNISKRCREGFGPAAQHERRGQLCSGPRGLLCSFLSFQAPGLVACPPVSHCLTCPGPLGLSLSSPRPLRGLYLLSLPGPQLQAGTQSRCAPPDAEMPPPHPPCPLLGLALLDAVSTSIFALRQYPTES